MRDTEFLTNNDKIRVTVSIITFLLVVWMLYSEFNYFVFPGYKFRFVPDADFTAKLKLNVDMTVAMPCDCKSFSDNPCIKGCVSVIMHG